ncbi:hypothetical protein [Thermocoleostomius sinensis]|uniref:Uncharacterized protein n=1 Tax=Thermocoleostomius sinensis A174 TaxID=2016057 RepID=A0A9E8Z9Y0_9CYAN|nr:hypothetical protein [Thermocoleostomius sinensis]WAL58957.1 hypothetical protein OXH18_17495 [Thermocoleostomius sinensis A174]
MKAKIENDVLFLHKDDVPHYKKKGSVVRNSYFWALRSIAGRANVGQDWEFESEVWLALRRVLLSFSDSGYLRLSETTLEFPIDQGEIPAVFRLIATWQSEEPDPDTEEETAPDTDEEWAS